jgi:hypothetical protein
LPQSLGERIFQIASFAPSKTTGQPPPQSKKPLNVTEDLRLTRLSLLVNLAAEFSIKELPLSSGFSGLPAI